MPDENAQPRDWADIAASEQYQTLPPERQERARQLYFDDVILPRVPKGSEQRARALFDQDTGTAAPRAAGPAEEGKGFTAGLRSGWDNMKAAGGGMVMLAGDKLGIPELKDAGLEIYQRNTEAAQENALGYGFTDLFDGEREDTSALDWAAHTAGAVLPSIATTIAGGGAGGIAAKGIASVAAKRAGVSAAKAAAKKAAAAKAGQAVGASAASFGQNAGSLMGQTDDADVAIAHGAAMAALDSIVPLAVLRKAGGAKLPEQAAQEIGARALAELRTTAGRGVAGAAGRSALVEGSKEAATEGLQALIEQHARYWAENDGASLLANTDEIDWKEAVDNAAAGGLAGGGLGVPAGLAERGHAARSVRQVDAAQQARQAPESEAKPEPAPSAEVLALPAPEPVIAVDEQGQARESAAPAWVNPRNDPQAEPVPLGGAGMEAQVERGEPAPVEGEFQRGTRQRLAELQAPRGVTLEGEVQHAALPPPEAIVVDVEGNAQRGATAPQVFERPLAGGRGLDQQAPTAIRRDDDFEFINRASGEPFQAHGAAKASKAFREAKKAGRNPTVAKVDGGFAVRVPADPKRYQMRPIDQAAHQAATSPSNDLPAPTPAQIEAGNYKKGHVRVQGLDISIENPRGSERSGTGPDGTPWRRTMSDHYGYLKRTTGADGEGVDAYVGPQEDSGQVFVVDQLNQQDGSFDEHKIMLGYPDEATALQAYSANFEKGWKVGPVTAMPVAEFKSWLKGGALSEPLAPLSPTVERPQPGPGGPAEQAAQEQSQPKGVRRAADRDSEAIAPTDPSQISDIAASREQNDMVSAQPTTPASKAKEQATELAKGKPSPAKPAAKTKPATIETRETDSGVSLYRLDGGESGQLQADAVTQALAASPELAGVKVVQSFDDLPLSARIRATRDGIAPDELRGIFSSGATYVVAGNHASVTDALYTAVHEEVGHRGIHGLLGDKLDATMERLYASQAASAKGRQRIAQIREAYAKVLRKLDARKQRLMIAEEMVALLIEDGERPTALQRVLSKIRELLRALIPQVPWTYTDILALGEQSRRWLRDNQAGAADGERTLYALGGKRQHTSEAFTDLTAKQKEALNKIAPRTAKQQAIDWFRDHSDRALLKIRQGLVDRYAALRELDEAAHGKDVLSTDIASSAWVLARMSSAASGALHAMLNNGRIYLDQQQKVIDIQDGEALGLGATLARLGSAAEIERFMGWIAGNRSAKLAAEGRENLFDAAEIDALRTLNRGTTEHGKARGALYSEVFTEFQQYRDDVLAIAEQTGVITPESRALWRDEFYVPFYRVMDEDGPAGPMASKGLTRQEAYKKLKGGSQNLNDLLQNTLLNFNHLLQASLRNQAAAQAVENAEQLGIAQPVNEAARDKKASTFVLKAGEKQWYNIADPLVFEALNSLSDAGLNNTAVRAMSFFKRLFTNMTTVTPQFIIANLLRDSMSATATSPVSKNFLKNIAVGGSNWTDARKRARMLASGGAFSFGHIYSNDPDEVKAHITRNLRSAKLIDGPKLVPQALKAGWDAWNAVANTAENANRAAIFEQNEQGSGKLAAAFEARDLMDFSMHGAWPAVRFLIRVVPFLNARLQGLDKLYRAGVKPSLLTAFGQGTASDKQAAARFMAVVGALSLASMALLLVNNEDEEYRKLEEWQKDTYWFVRLGGKAFFIPKPFEVGAIATMAERLLQQGIDDKATGKLFAQRLGHTLTQTFSFSPVPHMFQPVLDVYSNVDAFTGRPIESAGMDRLSKGLRARATTTAPARAASAVSRVFGDEFPLAVSPIQADHLIAGYLGQVGAWGAGMVDTLWRSANGESEPAKHWHEYQPIRRFYRDLDTPAAYTRYSTLFYEGLREAGKAYADVKELQELGRMDEAREVISEKRDVLGARKQLNQVQRRLTAINGRMDAVRLGDLDTDTKRRELDRLLVIKNRLTEMAGKRLEDMRAKR